MRILHVSDLYPPFIGGMEQHVRRLSVESVARGHDVEVATVRLPGTSAYESDGGVEVHRFDTGVARLPGAHQAADAPFLPPMVDPIFTKQLRELVARTRPDVVHTHGWSTFSAFHRGVVDVAPVVLTMHDYGAVCARKTLTQPGYRVCSGPALAKCLPCATEQYGPVKAAALTVALRASRTLLSRADMIVGVSRALLDAHAQYLPAEVPTSVIPPFLVPPPVPPDRPAWLPDQPFVMYVGTLTSHKGLMVLLDAITRSRTRPHLVAIGTRRAETPDEWPGGVTVRENVKHDEVLAAWAHATVGAVPSLWPEPFGLVAVEAMTFAVPPIVTDVGALPEIVAYGDCGLVVPPADPEALARAIDQLFDNPKLRGEIGARAQERARLYHADTVVSQNLDMYAALSRVRS